MGSFRTSLQYLRSLRLTNRTIGSPSTTEAVVRLSQAFSEVALLPESKSMREIVERLEQAYLEGQFSRLSTRDWKYSPWCLWLDPVHLAEKRGYIESYLSAIAARNRRSDTRRILSAYLTSYSPEIESTKTVGHFLDRAVTKWDWPWSDRHRRYAIFNEGGHRIVAERIASSDSKVEDILEDIGLSGTVGNGRFVECVFTELLMGLRRLRGMSYLREMLRLIAYAVFEGKLRFASLTPQLADALLLPWADSDPSQETRDFIEKFLLHHYGDPRIPGPKNLWGAVSEETRSIFLRWMVRLALEQFLQVVDQIALQRQWRFRRAFWMAYFNKGLIDGAWVAFAPQGETVAQNIFGEERGFASLVQGYNVDSGHAVLLLRIGGLTIADWSHNGKCHIWEPNHPDAPKMYRPTYTRRELTDNSSNSGVIHSAAAHGNWQRKVSDYISRRTGIRLSETEYMPD